MRPETRQRLRWQSTPEQQHGCAVRRDLVMVGPSDIRHRRLWENWKEPASEEWVRTFAIITTDANDMVSDIRDMPDILAPHDYRRACKTCIMAVLARICSNRRLASRKQFHANYPDGRETTRSRA
jgi:hypothetical protein